jgi:hypothetical protein
LSMVIFLSFPGETSACSCAETTPERAYRYADVVFAGTALRADNVVLVMSDGSDFPMVSYSFHVTHVWKGPPSDTLIVESARHDGSCASHFKVGTHYLLYASYGLYSPEVRGVLETSRCTRNWPYESALWDRYCLPEPVYLRQGADTTRVTKWDFLNRLSRDDVLALAHDETLREGTIPSLEAIIRDPSDKRGRMATTALAYVHGDARPAIGTLKWALREAGPEVRIGALYALRLLLAPVEFFDYLVAALSDSSSLVRACATQQITPIEMPEYSPLKKEKLLRILLEHIADPNPRVRSEAVVSMKWFADAESWIVPLLERMSKEDPVKDVRDTASGTLYEIRESKIRHE